VFPAGVVAWGARTLVGFDGRATSDDKYVPVRRTMLFIEESLYRGLAFRGVRAERRAALGRRSASPPARS
jgi:hypothetical protein